MKNVLCLWSGGIDSTYMVYDYLKKGYHVDCIYVKLHNNVVKTKMELQAIDLIYKELKKIGSIYKNENTFDINIYNAGNSVIFKQFPIWLNCLINSINSDHSEVAIGYIMNDDAISYLKDFKNIYYSYKPILEKLPPIKFPLSKIKKREIFTGLPKEISKYTVFCEIPIDESNDDKEIYKPCSFCDTCKKRKYYEEKGDIHSDEWVFHKCELVEVELSCESIEYIKDKEIHSK